MPKLSPLSAVSLGGGEKLPTAARSWSLCKLLICPWALREARPASLGSLHFLTTCEVLPCQDEFVS